MSNLMRMEEYVKKMNDTYGISITEQAEYQGFVKRKVVYTIYIPQLSSRTGDISYKSEDCKVMSTNNSKSTQRYLNWWLRTHKPFAERLKNNMDELRRN